MILFIAAIFKYELIIQILAIFLQVLAIFCCWYNLNFMRVYWIIVTQYLIIAILVFSEKNWIFFWKSKDLFKDANFLDPIRYYNYSYSIFNTVREYLILFPLAWRLTFLQRYSLWELFTSSLPFVKCWRTNFAYTIIFKVPKFPLSILVFQIII